MNDGGRGVLCFIVCATPAASEAETFVVPGAVHIHRAGLKGLLIAPIP
jgi:hypothetical protein